MLDLYYYTSSLVTTSSKSIWSYQGIYNLVKDDDLSQYPQLRFFVEAVRNLHRACSCDHPSIIASLEKAFKLLPEVITPEERQFLATRLNIQHIEFLT